MIVKLPAARGGAGIDFILAGKTHFGLVEVSVGAQRRAGSPLTFGTMADIDDVRLARDRHAKSAALAFRHSLHAAFSCPDIACPADLSPWLLRDPSIDQDVAAAFRVAVLIDKFIDTDPDKALACQSHRQAQDRPLDPTVFADAAMALTKAG
jgi:hypothetical protein